MRKQVGGASRSPAQHGQVSCEKPLGSGTVRALELVVTRGRDVIGVRQLLEGRACWIGPAQSSILPVPMTQFGGRPLVIAEVVETRCKVYVPPNARARLHGKDGLGRLLVGPAELEITEGERAVVVLGAEQIRTRVIHIESVRKVKPSTAREVVRWLMLGAAFCVVVFGAFALRGTAKTKRLDNGAVQRAVGPTLEHAAEKAKVRAAQVP